MVVEEEVMAEMAGSVEGGGGDQERRAIGGGVVSRDSMSIRVDTLPVAE